MIDKKKIEVGLYSKEPIIVEGIPVRSVSLEEMSRISIDKYNRYLSLVCSSLSDLPLTDLPEGITYFDILFSAACEDAEEREKIYKAFEIFFGDIPTVDPENGTFILPSGATITRDNFHDIQAVVKLRNGITEKGDDDYNPADEKTKAIIERMKEMRRKVERQRKNDEGGVSMGDLISATAAGLGLSLDEVMSYDMFQFNDQVARMRLFKDYATGVEALVHGAKAEDVNLKHWLSKPNVEDEEDE